MKYELTNQAEQDIIEIRRYTQKTWGKKQRIVYMKALHEGLDKIAKTPLIGSPVEYSTHEMQKYYIGQHAIFYRITHQKIVRIIRILHGRMDFQRHLN